MSVFLSGCGFVTDLLVTVVVDLLFMSVLLPGCGFVTDLFDIVVVGDLRVIFELLLDGTAFNLLY